MMDSTENTDGQTDKDGQFSDLTEYQKQSGRYEMYRSLLMHEDVLTQNRLSYFATSQGLLIVALNLSGEHTWISVVVPVFGVISAIFATFWSIQSERAIGELVAEWTSENYASKFPRIIGLRYQVTTINFLMSPKILTGLFAAFWIAVIAFTIPEFQLGEVLPPGIQEPMGEDLPSGTQESK